MICDLCGREHARVRRISRSYGKGASLLVIENVPVVRCPDCGGSYLTADTLRQLERMKAKRRRAADKRPIAVAEFA